MKLNNEKTSVMQELLGVRLHCHRSQVDSGLEWQHQIGSYLLVSKLCNYAKLNCLKLTVFTMVLDAFLLNTQHYMVRIKVKWSNPGKGVVPFSTPQCCSYRKRNLRITLDYGGQLIASVKYFRISSDDMYLFFFCVNKKTVYLYKTELSEIELFHHLTLGKQMIDV